jgi:hypothetical protein
MKTPKTTAAKKFPKSPDKKIPAGKKVSEQKVQKNRIKQNLG